MKGAPAPIHYPMYCIEYDMHGSFKNNYHAQLPKQKHPKLLRRIQLLGITFLAGFHFGISSEKLPKQPSKWKSLGVSFTQDFTQDFMQDFTQDFYRGKKLLKFISPTSISQLHHLRNYRQLLSIVFRNQLQHYIYDCLIVMEVAAV